MIYTPRERVLAAMNLQKPDRVPLMCQFSIGAMIQQLKPSPAEFWYDGEVFARGLVELRERFNFDGILVSLHGHSPDWKKDVLEIRAMKDSANAAAVSAASQGRVVSSRSRAIRRAPTAHSPAAAP